VRIGQGFDAHAFADDLERALVLGGVRIPGEVGLTGHSDGDVVLHAVADALLGACGLGDLGSVFGTDDPAYALASSQVFVAEALRRCAHAGWAPGNIDCTVVTQRPRLGPHQAAMRSTMAGMLGLEAEAVSVKITSTDAMGAIGNAEGIACLAVVSMLPSPT
jgi:2-C-methyl-D-erythritol 2,4-cyclodiphosphate synthase